MDEAKQKKPKAKAESGAKTDAKNADGAAAGNKNGGDGEGVFLSIDDFEDLKKRIDAIKQEKEDMVAMAQRVQADFDNYRKRNATVRTDGMQDGVRSVLEALLSVLDNFDLSIAASKEAGMDEKWLSGFEMVHRQLLDALTKQGLDPIPAEKGQDFDPNMHEAVMCEQVDGVEQGKILETLKKGYRMNERLIRASMVKISG